MATILRLIFGFYFASVAIEYVFLPYFFAARGLSPASIGVLFTGRVVVVLLFQMKLASLADQLGRPHLILRVAMLAQFGGAVALIFANSFVSLASIFWLQAILRAPIVPVIDATTVRSVGSKRYATIRVLGSLGFGLCAALLGRASVHLDYDQTGELASLIYPALTALASVATLALPRETGPFPERRERADGLWRSAYVVFILWNALHWVSVASYNTFFSLHVKQLGLRPSVSGDAMGVAIAGEILAFLLAPALFRGGHASHWAMVALVLSAARWLLTAWVTEPGLLIMIQALHLFSFGVWYAAAIEQLGHFAGSRHRATYQGVFSAGVLALGSIVGSLGGGYLLELAGGTWLFTAAAGVDLLALGVALVFWRAWTIRLP